MSSKRESLGILDVEEKKKRARVSRNIAVRDSGGEISIEGLADDDESDSQHLKRKTPIKKSFIENVTKKETMVVSVDLGMTNSALAFSIETADPHGVVCEKHWPGSSEQRSKVPTMIAYRHENSKHEDFDDDEGSKFGFAVDPSEMKHHAFFKLSLDENAPASKFDDAVLEAETSGVLLAKSTGKQGRAAIEDSLRHLRKIVQGKITEQCGDEMLDRCNLKVMLTHPAACSDMGKAILANAANAAGWKRRKGDRIALQSESEAACVAALVGSQARYGRQAWDEAHRTRSPLVVLDIGGLTVDAAVLRVQQIMPKLLVNQICPGQGGKCGTVALYCRLHGLLDAWFGNAFQACSSEQVGHGSPLLTQFETLLRKFDGTKPSVGRLPLVMEGVIGSDHYDDLSGHVMLPCSDTKMIMDGTLDHMKAILDDQIDRAAKETDVSVKVVILCGGGSLFPYLYEKLKYYCKNHASGQKDLIRPDDPQSAVVRGALIGGLQQAVMGKRRSRAAYGIAVHEQYREGDWSSHDVFDCTYGGRRIDGFMRWHLQKNDEIDTSKPKVGKRIDGYVMLKHCDLDRPNFRVRIAIYTYTGDGPPPARREHPGVQRVGRLSLKISDMSPAMKRKLLRKQRVETKTPQKISVFQLVNAESGKIEFEARVGTKAIGRYELDYETTEAI